VVNNLAGGRPKGSTGSLGSAALAGRLAARQHADEAMKTLVNIIKTGTSEAAKVTAASDILNRAYGKPTQAIEHSGPDGGPIENTVVNDAERFTSAIAGLIARARTQESSEPTQH
jgi:hypothetical protein